MKNRAFIWGLSAFAFSLLFSVSVSGDVVDYVDLTPEQTLALYGSSINGQYWNGNEFDACTFSYCYTFTPSQIHPMNFYPDISETDSNYMNNRSYLVYEMDSDSAVSNDIITSSDSRITFELIPSVSVSGIAYYRQYVGFSVVPQSENGRLIVDKNYNFFSSNYDYSASPIISYPSNYGTLSNADRLKVNRAYFTVPFDAVGSPPSSDSGVSPTNLQLYFAFYDIYGQNLVNGVEQTFSLTGQHLSASGLSSYGWESSSLREHHYFIFISCPRVTDGYVLPEPEHSYPSIDSQLDNLVNATNGNTTLLQQILAKLDLIYQKEYSVNVNIDSSSIVSGIVDGLKGLFVPTQQDIMDFRLNMMTLCNSSLAPFWNVEALRDDAINTIMHSPTINYVDVPLIDLRSNNIPFYFTAENFPEFEVLNNKLRVPLKVGSSWNWFYDLVAWAIDVIAVLAFVNMVINKIHAFFLGDKVVEIDDN